MYHLPTLTERRPGSGERRIDNDEWITPLGGVWSLELAALCGFVPIVRTPAPADTDVVFYTRSILVVDDVPTEEWTATNRSVDDIAVRVGENNRLALEVKLRTNLQTNKTYLALVSPSNAQVVAHTKALTRQINALIRHTLGADTLSDTTDT